MSDFKPSVKVNTKAEEKAEVNVTEQNFSAEETANQLRINEEDFLQGIIDAVGDIAEETQRIEIIRKDPRTKADRLYYAFSIRGLSDTEYAKAKKRATKYVRNKQLGVKMPEDTDNTQYRSLLIYTATTAEDREKLWDNKKVWEALRSKGHGIATGTDVVEVALKAGEKDAVIDAIDKLSGFGDNLEEVTKN